MCYLLMVTFLVVMTVVILDSLRFDKFDTTCFSICQGYVKKMFKVFFLCMLKVQISAQCDLTDGKLLRNQCKIIL